MWNASSVFIALVMSLIAGVQATAQEPGGNPSPTPEHKKLAAFVGTWKEDLEVRGSQEAPARKASFTEKCEWFTGGFTVICHNEWVGTDLKGLQVMTYDADGKVYKDYEFDSAGNNSFATGTLEADTWTWRGDNKFHGKLVKTRVTMKALSPDSIATKTEMLDDNDTWKLLSESKRNRVK